MEQHPRPKGVVYLVGAGPGDAGLITVKGLRCLQEADVVVYDRLAGPRLMQYAKRGARKIYVGKLPDRHAMKQEDINRLLVELALEGHTVTRLKGGDPCVFGRVGEEAALLAEHSIRYEIVPGVTSAVAAPAYAGIPVTHRNRASSFCVVTGHESPDKLDEMIEWDKLTQATGTLLFLMGVAKLRYIAERLMTCGRAPDTPVALVRWGTRAEQATITGTLATIADEVERAGFASPAVIVVGEVVLERERLQWAESRPLFGRRVLVTRARDQASELTRRIEDAGGEPYEYPVIELRMPESPASREALRQALARPDAYDWLVLTSVNGVRFWFRHLQEHGADIRQWAHVRIVSVGPKTTEALREYGIQPDIAASQFSQEGVWEALRPHAAAGQRVLLARGDLSRSWLRETMEAHGLHADEVDLYETVLPEEDDPELIEMLEQQMIHIVTFTSSSTVTNLMAALRRMGMDDPAQALRGASIACIGEITARTAREAGLHVDVIAASSTIDGLMEAMLELGKMKKKLF
ncbi:uroporphyrinogen-III C-methyltransferase [Paenibacillus dendritiformis]|uniref:uroporphyrinogen-III C-methyltransferase n=1 Tax=Paenibacillus dendritiformis TaxID=130049 RepID=UPI0010596376|nr:uroporphyrinogen-III C-methyltransferase [Paenibacillus dendritiformis]TDL50866.1 uroporphyrinogen-III C-methyltransferase [Paenibacillus dendritiformis]